MLSKEYQEVPAVALDDHSFANTRWKTLFAAHPLIGHRESNPGQRGRRPCRE